jgi:hypothetical protein
VTLPSLTNTPILPEGSPSHVHVWEKNVPWSLFEPSTEVIRKGKAGKPNEFGKMMKLQEAENQIIVDYEVYAQRPNDSDLLQRNLRLGLEPDRTRNMHLGTAGLIVDPISRLLI